MKPVNVGIIGAGARTIGFCLYAQSNPDKMIVKAIADINTAKAECINNHFKLNADIYADYNELIADKDITGIIISTPDYLHTEPAIAALKAHKDVYLEKPLATTIEDCDKIIQASKDSKSRCYLGFNMRHSPVHEKIFELIHTEKKLGRVTTIEANEWYYGGKTYFRRWNRLRKFGGGLWLTKACHDFDLIKWIANGNPEKIYATSSLSLYKPVKDVGPRCRDCKIKDTCPDFYDLNKKMDNEFEELWRQLQLLMPQDNDNAPDICLYNSAKDTFDNGIAVIDFDNDIRATYTVNVLASKGTRQMRVIGTEGMVEADMEKGIVTYIQRHTGKETVYDINEQIKGGHGGADQKILSDFVNMCRNGSKPKSDLADGKLAVAMSIAATASCDNGRKEDFII